MTWDQSAVILVLLGMFILFAWGRPRYDVVALLGLLAMTLLGLSPVETAFSGFGHGAVVTVAAVLVISRALMNSGVIDSVERWVSRAGKNLVVQLAVLTPLVAVCSAFINNVGALAIFLPITLRMAAKSGTSPSLLLMPLAFASLLGGLTTLIGTPPNIIIATFRAQQGGEQFLMFDFLPVGGAIVLVGLLFLVLLGWRLIPVRRSKSDEEEMFELSEYITELIVPEESSLVGERVHQLEQMEGVELTVVNLLRNQRSFPALHANHTLRSGDSIVVRADAEDLEELLKNTDLELAGQAEKHRDLVAGSDEVTLVEVVIMPGSPLEGRTAGGLRLRARYGVNLLAVARQGSRLRSRLSRIRLREGDVLLLQGNADTVTDVLGDWKCLPLASRGLRLAKPRRLLLVTAIFLLAIGLTSLGMLPVQLVLTSAAVAMVLTNFISAREAYESIDWSVIVLLGAMIPVGEALQQTGTAQLLADHLLILAGQMEPWIMVAIFLITTMFLSDLINNAAAALLMAPVAMNVAMGMGVNFDSFLMAVAIGASCAFLTPIGHQSNTLVMGPGGYRFGDYWRMGLPLELIIVVVAVPIILQVWPL